jgi:DNA-binding SARP family transcriptional activator
MSSQLALAQWPHSPEVELSRRPHRPRSLSVRLLGPLSVSRCGLPLSPPASKKVRALFAYLSLAPNPVTRGRLCDLLWDGAQDPRGELRWCLSKLRGFVDSPNSMSRVQTPADTVGLDLANCAVDVVAIGQAINEGVNSLSPDRLRASSKMFAGEFLDGLEMDRSPTFDAWLVAQRRRFRCHHIAVLRRLVETVSGDEIFVYLDAWLQIEPFDLSAHGFMLRALALRGRIRDGEAHLVATARLFRADELNPAPLREYWKSARAEAESSVPSVLAIAIAGRH